MQFEPTHCSALPCGSRTGGFRLSEIKFTPPKRILDVHEQQQQCVGRAVLCCFSSQLSAQGEQPSVGRAVPMDICQELGSDPPTSAHPLLSTW